MMGTGTTVKRPGVIGYTQVHLSHFLSSLMLFISSVQPFHTTSLYHVFIFLFIFYPAYEKESVLNNMLTLLSCSYREAHASHCPLYYTTLCTVLC